MVTKKLVKLSCLICFFYSNLLVAADNNADGSTIKVAAGLGDIFDNFAKSFPQIVALLFGLSVVAGLSFAIAAIFKFKQHKDNPAQVTIGQPIGLLLLGAAVIWLPFILKSIGYTITGAQTNEQLQQGQSVLEGGAQPDGGGFGKFLSPQ